MLNKDKRSLLLLLALGDGCLYYIHNSNRIYGAITIDHGIEQADYQKWKAELLTYISGKNVNVRTGHRGKSVQVSLCMKRIRAWRKFTYPNDKKSIPKLLKFIRHPELALAVLLMDDGYVQYNKNSRKINSRLRIYLSDQTEEQLNEVIQWLKINFDIDVKISWWLDKRRTKRYPYLKMTERDSLLIWKSLRSFILQFKSMQYKFRFIERNYQLKYL
jgi:hypothetical protein